MVSEARRAYLREWRARRKMGEGDPAPRRVGRPRKADQVVDGLAVAISGLSQAQRDEILQRINK